MIVPDANILIAGALNISRKKEKFSEKAEEILQGCFERNIQLIVPERIEDEYIDTICKKNNS